MAAKKKSTAAPEVKPITIEPEQPPKPKQLSYERIVANLTEFLARIDKKPYPSQLEVIRKAVDYYNAGAKYVVLESPVGCHAKGEEVLLASGVRIAAEDVQVGDMLLSLDGTEWRCVRELRRGRQMMACITPVKGESFTVNLDHVLTLKRTPQTKRSGPARKDCLDGKLIDVTVREWLTWSKTMKSTYKLVRSPGVSYFQGDQDGANLPLEPYLLGLLLGDGRLGGCIEVCKKDPEIHQALVEHLEVLNGYTEDHPLHLRETGSGWAITTGHASGAAGRNIVAKKLRQLNLFGTTSHTKFIPQEYLSSTMQARLELLAGLIDTDGSLGVGGFDYISASEQLADGVTFLARSVGLAAYMGPCEKRDQNGHGGTYFRVSISGETSKVPTRIKRKQAPTRKQKKSVLVTGIKNVELVGVQDFYGWTLDGDGRYLMGDFTLTHNSGKSAIANAIAREMGTSYTLTLSEQLQDQYVKDFNEYGVEPLKGRGKFTCHNMGRVKGKPAGTCADGKHFFSGKTACVNCPYTIAKEKALAAPHCVANYHSYLYNVGFGWGPAEGEGKEGGDATGMAPQGAIMQRDLTIVDECHAAEAFLLGIVGVEIHLDRLPFPNPPPRGVDVQPYMSYVEKELLPRCKKARASMVDPKAKEDLEGLMAKCRFMLSSKDDTWIVDRGEKDNGNLDPTWFGMKPLFVHRYGKWLLGGGDRYLLMSGTVLSAAHLVEALGLDPATGDLIEMPSQFPVENRPVYAHSLDMTMKSRDESWPIMVEEINRILDFHANEKGLILPQSNAMSKYILERLTPRNRARIITASGEGRMDKYREHTTSTQPTVLMAPGMWEGVDLKGDLSRFQVIPSFPRPPWKGHTKARAEKEKGWYRLQTMTKGMQGMGRSVRSETDHAVTYVLDRDFLKECGMAGGMVPGWLKDAVHPWDESPHLKVPAAVVAAAAKPATQPRRR